MRLPDKLRQDAVLMGWGVAHKSHYRNDVPFEVPEGWVWCKVKDIALSILYGVSESAKPSGEYRLLRITDIQDNKVAWDLVPYTDYDEIAAQNYILRSGDILFARTGATVGKSYLVEDIDCLSIYASYLIRIQTSKAVNPKYVKRFFESGYYWEQISESSIGVGQPNVNGTSLANLMIPIPPMCEQNKIVAESEKWISIIDRIDGCIYDVANLISAAKSKILTLAISGKLVPQDPTDEPAIDLLKRINPDFVACDKPHYEPQGWSFMPLGNICDTINGLWKGKKEPFVNVGVIRNANFTKDFQLNYTNIEYLDVEASAFAKRSLRNGDLVVEKSGGSDKNPVGRAILYEGEDGKYSFSNFTMALRIKDCRVMNSKFLYYAIMALYMRGDMIQMQTQTTGLHNLIGEKYLAMLIPVPPMEEQNRIVNRIEQLFSSLNRIMTVLS